MTGKKFVQPKMSRMCLFCSASDNVNDNVHVDAQPSNNNDLEIEPVVDLDNPQV